MDHEQGSAAWFAARLGKVTASRMADVMAKVKTGEAASVVNYRAQLVGERLTGMVADGFVNDDMVRGTELEPQARLAYEWQADAEVQQVGFVPHPKLREAGASPDGLVGEDGGIEIKCPRLSTHLATALNPKIDRRYMLQMQWGMACTGRAWWDFVSFHPDVPEGMRLIVIRVDRDDAMIADMEEAVADFLDTVEEMENAARERFGIPRQAAEAAA